MTTDKTLAVAIIYTVSGFLTFGHVFNTNYVEPTPVEQCGEKPNIVDDFDGWNRWYDCTHPRYVETSASMAAIPAFYAGIGWPVYWACKLAIKVTK